MRKLMCLLLSLVMMLALPLGSFAENDEGFVEEIQQDPVVQPEPVAVPEQPVEHEQVTDPLSEEEEEKVPIESPDLISEQDSEESSTGDNTPAIRFDFAEGKEEKIEVYVGDILTVPCFLSASVAAENPEVRWSSSDEDVAAVDEESGEIQALSQGKTDITAELPEGESASFLLVVVAKGTSNDLRSEDESSEDTVSVQSFVLTLPQEPVELAIGQVFAVSYTLVPAKTEEEMEAAEEYMLPDVTWSSLDESVAMVDESGTITGIALGETQITAAMENGDAQSLDVSVINAGPDFVSMINAGQILDAGSLLQRVAPDLAADHWVSQDETMAQVLEGGQVMALAEGSVIVDAYDSANEIVFSLQLNILPPRPGDAPIAGTYLYWNYDAGTATLHIWGNDIMPSFNASNRPWTAYLSTIQKIQLTSVQDIGTYAFAGCTALVSVEGLSSVGKIGENAFNGCTALPTFSFPGFIPKVERRTFYGCTALTSVTLPSTVTTIEAEAFTGCTALTVANLQTTNVSTMGTGAFSWCTSLRNVDFPATLSVLPDYAFQNCTSLISIAIPNTMPTVGSNAFSGCTALTTVTIAEGVTTLGSSAFSGCTSLLGISLPSSVTTVGSGLFRNCTLLRNFYASGLTDIADEMFYGCTALTQLPIYPSMNHIGNRAFQGCTALTSISIPSTVLTMGNYVFSGCTAMTSASVPGTLGTVSPFTFNGCTALSNVTLGNGITLIDESAFNRCSALGSISLPNTLLIINKSAFEGCGALGSIIIPNSVTDIGESAFANCRSLGNITLSNSLTAINGKTFYYCTALASIDIPSSVNAIGNSAFEGCSSLIQMVFPISVQAIGSSAFLNCTKLTRLYFSNGLLRIGSDAFRNCSALTMPVLPNSLTSIESGAFSGCASLVNMIFPANLTFLGDNAFYNSPLKFAIFLGNAPHMGASVFGGGGVQKVKYYQGNSNFSTPIWYSLPCYPIIDPTSFITSIYTVGIGRAPSANELLAWRNDIFFENVTGASLVEGFLLKGEFAASDVSITTFILSVYRACFNRVASTNEINAWLEFFDAGNTRRGMIHEIMKSLEYTRLVASLGISLGTLPRSTPSDLNPSLGRFVGRLYVILLQRYPADREIDAWVADLLSKATTGTKAVEAIVFNSSEFYTQTMTDRDYVNRLYRTLVGRSPGTSEEDAWLADMVMLGGRRPSFSTFVTSNEYKSLMASYGVNP